jgi:hypothetical protein
MRSDAAQRAFNVADFVPPAYRRRQPVFDIEHGIAEPVEPAVPIRHVAAIALDEGAAVDADQGGPRPGAGFSGGRPDIEHQLGAIRRDAVGHGAAGLGGSQV